MKVNTSNYFETIEQVGVKNLPADFQEMHKFVIDTHRTGKNKKGDEWFYYNDADIKELIDNYFTALSEHLNKGSNTATPKKEKQTKLAKSKPVHQKESDEDDLEIVVPLYSEGQTLYERKSGKKVIVKSIAISERPNNGERYPVYTLDDDSGKFYRALVAEKELTDVQPTQSTKQNSSDREGMSDPSKSLYKKGQTVYRVSDGAALVVESVQVQLTKKGYWYNLIEGNGKYLESIPEAELTDIAPANRPKQRHKHQYKSDTSKLATKKDSPPSRKKATDSQKDETESEQVEMISPEVAFIREWVAMNGKVKPIERIAGFLKRLQLSFVEKRIRKSSPHAKEITEVQRMAIQHHKQMEKSPRKQFTVEIPPAWHNRLLHVAGLQHMMPTVQLIKAYLRLMGKPITLQEVINLYNRIKKGADTKKFGNDDPYIQQIKEVTRSLQVFAKAKKGTGILEIHPAQLNGLQSVLDGCTCHTLQGFDVEIDDDEIVADHQSENEREETDEDDTPKSMTAEEAASRQYQMLNITDPRFAFLGDVAKRFTMMVHGIPGAGKTTFLILFAEFLATTYGRVLYVTPEEYDTPTLTQLLERLNIRAGGNLDFVERIEDKNPSDYDFVFIDSVNDHDMTYAEFRALKKKHKQQCFIAVFQTTKDGDFRGVQKWKHKADLALELVDGNITITKSRFGSLGNVGQVPGFVKVVKNVSLTNN